MSEEEIVSPIIEGAEVEPEVLIQLDPSAELTSPPPDDAPAEPTAEPDGEILQPIDPHEGKHWDFNCQAWVPDATH